MMYLIKDDGINTYKVEITGKGGCSVSNNLKADEVLRLIKQALLGKWKVTKTPKKRKQPHL